MTSPQARKGRNAELAVAAYLASAGFPNAEPTRRSGWADDGAIGPCLEYQGDINPDGYGRHRKMTNGARRQWQVHRVVYEMAFGTIPDGLLVRHKCDNPPCVRIDHLELGTKSDNSHDMHQRGRFRPCPGERNGQASLSRSTVNEIRHYVATANRRGAQAEASRRFGITPQQVSRIVKGDRWATGS